MKPIVFLAAILLWATAGAQNQFPFTEISSDAGINHFFQVESATFGGGAAVLDFDNDGWEDVYITGGKNPDVLYKNNGDGTFTNVFEKAGGFEATKSLNTHGASAADINRDGYKDLLVTTMNYFGNLQDMAPNLLYINNGDGTFTDATETYGLSDFTSFSTSATFGDINADGFPDLYISNYFYLPSVNSFSVLNEAIINNTFQPAPDFLFINAGGKYFIDATELYGVDHTGYGFQGVFSDYDNDRDLDLLIVNDFGTKKTPNVFLRNDYPKKNLQDRSLNVAFNYGMNAMGIARGDINGDGWMDYFVTNIGTSLYLENQHNGTPFVDKTFDRGLVKSVIEDPQYNGVPISWGTNFFDYDHDLDLDLFISNGALNPTIRLNPNLFFENNGFGFFFERSLVLGLNDPQIGRGSVTFDYDKDGDLDLLVVNQKARDPGYDLPQARTLLFRNDVASRSWLQIELEGIQAEKNGIGSRVEVVAGGKKLIREIDGGSSHSSQNSTIAHFGLDNFRTVDSIIVKWVGGHTQLLTNIETNQRITIREEIKNITSTEDKLTVFPTLFSQQVFIDYNINAEIIAVDVFDMKGKRIATLSDFPKDRSSGFYFWRAPAGLERGVYIVTIETNEGTLSRQIIKG